jgi:hypothetical protein
MPEPSQFTWTHKELVTLLIKAQGIHEGRWFLMMNFSTTGATLGPSDNEMNPGLMIAITAVGIQRQLPGQNFPAPLLVDAAEVNPAPK